MLFNFFKKKVQEKPKIEIVENLNTKILDISIQINVDNNMMVLADFNDKAKPDIVSLALVMLSNGQLLPFILEALLKSSESVNKQLLLNKILTECNKTLKDIDNDPVIKPSDVFMPNNEK